MVKTVQELNDDDEDEVQEFYEWLIKQMQTDNFLTL